MSFKLIKQIVAVCFFIGFVLAGCTQSNKDPAYDESSQDDFPADRTSVEADLDTAVVRGESIDTSANMNNNSADSVR